MYVLPFVHIPQTAQENQLMKLANRSLENVAKFKYS
jgi:hypothetical protein